MSKDLFGYCGLYCGGCRSEGPVAVWCDTQCSIKNCCREKGLENCLACGENPCEKMKGFMEDPAYPYHLEVQENMKRLREVGTEQWESEMQARYRCKSCARQFNWFEKTCSACGKPTP